MAIDTGRLQRAAKKVREARKLLVAAGEQAPEIGLDSAVEFAIEAEVRAAQLLQERFNQRKDAA